MIPPSRKLVESRLGFGCGRLKAGGDRRRSGKLIQIALDEGIRHFDVAPLYGMGEAENVLGEELKNASVPVSIATKVGIARPRPAAWWKIARRALKPIVAAVPGARAKAARLAVPSRRETCFDKEFLLSSFDESLSRLQVGAVEVLFLHEPPLNLDADALGEVLLPLVESGQTRHLGSSTGSSLSDLPHFGTAAQYRFSCSDRLPVHKLAWEAQHGVIRFYGPSVADALSMSKRLSEYADDIASGAGRKIGVGALCLAYALETTKTRILFSSDNPERVRATITTLRAIIESSEWPAVASAIASKMSTAEPR